MAALGDDSFFVLPLPTVAVAVALQMSMPPPSPPHPPNAGCLNGGGQLRPASGQSPSQLIEQLEMAYHE